MEKKKLDALLSLLNDPDKATFEAVADSLVLDADIIPALEDLWQQTDNETVVARLDWLIHRARFNKLISDLDEWKSSWEADIIKGAWLVTTYQFPDLPFAEVDGAVANIAKDVWLELRDDMTSTEKVEVMNRTIFGKYGLQPDTSSILSLNNVLINNVLRLKKGNHLGLLLIYLGVAQRLNIPMFGVPTPRSFVLAYISILSGGVELYIDPFNQGKIVSKEKLRYRIEKQGYTFEDEFIQPHSDVVMIQMLVAELMVLSEQKGMNQQAKDMEILLNRLRTKQRN